MKPEKRDKKRSRNFDNLFLVTYPGRSQFAEAFRSLRTNIEFSFMDKEFRSILVTSAGEEEGKTITGDNQTTGISAIHIVSVISNNPFYELRWTPNQATDRRDSNPGLSF